MKKLLFFTLPFLFSFALLQAQNEQGKTIKRCGTADADKLRQANDPVYKAQREATEKYVEKWVTEHPNYDPKTSVVTVPIVVHVLYTSSSSAECISLAQVQSQIDATNADWAGLNSHSMNAFSSSLKANTGVQFCLASKDPSGNATNGVDYKQTTVSSFNITGSSASCTGYPERCSSSGGAAAWDVTKYMNVWVCNMGSSGLCGISEFPGSSSNNVYYGSSINYLYFGTIGTATYPYNLGGTLSHELGHCFNLYHTWGDDGGSCSGTDNCADTPNQANCYYGSHEHNTLSESGGTGSATMQTDACTTTSPGNLYEDFMDYTDDLDYACFTPNQVSRIQAIATGVNASLGVASLTKCTLTGILEKDPISNIEIYPNPSNGVVNVMFDVADKNNVTISVNNLLGEMISKIDKENVSSVNIPIDLSAQSAGVYFIKIQSGNSTITKKIVLFR